MAYAWIFNVNEIVSTKQAEAFPDLVVEIEKRHLTEAEQAELKSEESEESAE
ncbi:hypothetical protein [Paraherbaspirillum soli]|uniref:Uncharacterized protein n=1 Tax=Paraherbaspirillum soli TaxID=631222 RepID=A0ABW0MCU6_9BURK